MYSETLQKFRLAARGHGAQQPPAQHRQRVETYFDPLPIWYEPLASGGSMQVAAPAADSRDNTRVASEFPLHALTQRPMFMYHAWGSQNAWLRQIAARNFLYLHPTTAAAHGVSNDDWVHVDSALGRITVQARLAANVQADTVWTWNAIGKRRGAWKLAADAPESSKGFLLNHLISERDPSNEYANADPVTGQAAWFDLRVRISPAGPETDAKNGSQPQFPTLPMGNPDPAPLRYGAHWRGRNEQE
jgi:anaerobic selenocysteine-containing dehydrogenase